MVMRPGADSARKKARLKELDHRQANRTVGLVRRLSALIYDGFLLLAVFFATTLLLLLLRGGRPFTPQDPYYSACLVLVGGIFFGWFWTHGGQTLGMRAWKIKLETVDGQPVTWRHAAVRGVSALLGAACLGLGYFWVLVDSERRSFQDIASGTRLVRYDPRDQTGA